jgi:signal transduction histidine kinase/HAMP domain-containing protein/DNA-binding response OmpR family regulator
MQPNKAALNTKTANGPLAGEHIDPPSPKVSEQNASLELQELLHALQAMRAGDFSVRIAGERTGLVGKIADTFNDIVGANERMAQQLERAEQVVGREGRTRHRVKFALPNGAWSEMEDSVNTLIDDLLWPTAEVTRVIGAVAQGDLLQTVRLDVDGRPLKGEFLRSANIVNRMIKQLGVFTSEVTRVAREVGTEGKLGGQAKVREVTGVWKDLTDNVNSMASNLTAQVRNISEVTIAVANGDLSKKITVDVRGEILQLKEAINTMVDQLRAFASEVTRVAREVGTEGKLGGQAIVPGVAGTWKDLTDNVNSMASNLTNQVRSIAEVTTAVARGDLSRKITVDVRGEILELKDTINTMVDQLNAFAWEVTRVAREVGTEGKLGGQAQVPGVAGTWKDLTDNVNLMAGNLTAQVRNIAEVATAIAGGDLSKKITVDVRGEMLLLKDTLNTMVEQLRSFAAEVTRVAREVGTDGKLGGQAHVPGVAGTWKDLTDNVNLLGANLTTQVRNIAEVTTAVARGDLSRKITVDVQGEILELKNTINTMVDQLNAFASEVTRVAREVGTDGKLGGQARVPGAAGTWKDLTDTVNVMAANLTEQVRGIVKVVTAVANGDLKEKLTVQSKGEVAALAETINNMTGTLATFADQVTTVAREVGVEGRLGGQANVPGASGTWKDLTGNVNLLAANLTTQVRAIAEVATAVTKGDLTRSIQVDARGEVAELKDNINTMIGNLRLTTERNMEQDWLKTNLAKFTTMLQGQRDFATVGRLLLTEITPLVNAQLGVIYRVDNSFENPCLRLVSAYADDGLEGHREALQFGDGLIGQCAADKRRMLITEPTPDAVPVSSASFKAFPKNVIVLPVLFENQLKGVIELASLSTFNALQIAFLEQLTDSFGTVLSSIEATMQTEGLLKQSQQLAAELQSQQSELQQTNDQLEQKALQLAESNVEIEQARRALEEKASELALTSKYKSEFLANMSHELRTPLNSILVLSQQLAENADGNLVPKQVEFSRTIHGAGTDLLHLITDILDLSKIESGTVTVEADEVQIASLVDAVSRQFRHEAERRQLAFDMWVDPSLGRSIFTDSKRLQQVLKNLMSNALKFTEEGSVKLNVHAAVGGWSAQHSALNQSPLVVAFEVTDTGIGIAADKQKIIFEAFQQADASTSRKYGGTGLGLAICRELANLLGGELTLHSIPGSGSTFTLYLPIKFSGPATIPRFPSPGTAPLLQHLDVERASERAIEEISDDRDQIQPGDRTLLIVEDDPHYARLLADLAHDQDFKVLITPRGGEALDLVKRFDISAISLDIFLPDTIGWNVLSNLKQNPATRHIPVQIVTSDDDRQHGLARGAFSFLTKTANSQDLKGAFSRIRSYTAKPTKRLLVTEDNAAEQLSIRELLGHDDIEIVTASTGAQCMDLLHTQPFDCAVFDLRLPDISGFDLLKQVSAEPAFADLPIVVFTGRELSADEDAQLHAMARSIIVKGVESPERLLDETALFLHRSLDKLPADKQRMLERLRDSDEQLAGRTVVLVDDDARNVFALSSVLERRGMNVLTSTTGSEAIQLVNSNPQVSIVLMDIMMPGMDGYQAIGAIRANPAWRRLPIIALTAKAMKGDREKCLEAGASDYLAKPVNTEQLLSTLRNWLHR